ncbi:MAG TPA: sulfatase [Candidatus Sulfotelmatobacter sp.]|jgi:arylsulfatase A-like enzyme
MGAKKSIVLVTVDCLRADHVGFMGYDRPTTPFLDSLANESFVLPTAIVAGAPTYYSLPAILASRYPLALGRDVLGLAPDESTLASTLKQAGYATAAFSAANPYISSRFGYGRGFDTFRDFLQPEDELSPLSDGGNDDRNHDGSANAPGGGGWAGRLNRRLQKAGAALGPWGAIYGEVYFEYCQRVTPPADSLDQLRRFPAADSIVDEACAWLSSVGNSPFFLWLHLMDPHAPYYPTEAALALMGHAPVTPYRARYLNSYWNRSDLGARRLARHRDEIVALYDAGVRWADAQMGRLVETLRRQNLWSDTVFAFTADHGEEFLEHEGRFHPPSKLMEELLHVPLLLRVPGSAKQPVKKSPFSLVHLAPTLLDIAELPVPPGFQGRSYWPQLRKEEDFDGVAISECIAGCTNPFRRENRSGPRMLSVRESRFKLVLRFDRAAEDLYDLESDPDEQMPVTPDAEKAMRRRLLEIARRHLQRSIEQGDWRARLQARLRELQLEWKKPAGTSASVSGSKPSPVASWL